MNLFKTVDIYVGRKIYPFSVRWDARTLRMAGVIVPDVMSRIIYNKREKDWKSYGISFNQISAVVKEYCEIKPLNGISLWFNLFKARSAIRDAVKQKRIVFTGNDKAEYTDRGYVKYKVSFAGLEQIFIDKVERCFPKGSIVKILNAEYTKQCGK